MSNQYPGGYNSPVGGHRGNYNNQMVNMVPNQMGMMGYSQQGNMMPQQQQQQSQMQNPNSIGQIGHSSVGMQSPSHLQQSPNPQQQQQQQQQQQLQQQTPQLSLQTSNTPTTNPALISQPTMQSGGPTTGMLASAPQLPQKEINTVSLTRLGQETVQDITSRFQEIFSALKTIQPTTGNRENSTEKKVQEYFRTIRLLFKRVRIIYEKSSDGCSQGMEFTHVESLIPYKDESDHRAESTQCEEYKKALNENRELTDTVMLKNKQLREIIDRTRIIIWEINTMLSMRRS